MILAQCHDFMLYTKNNNLARRHRHTQQLATRA